jgi:hypothetical protein
MAHSRAVLASTVSVIVLSSLPASAQEAGDDGVLVLDDIYVRGELQARSLQDTPTSVAVETGGAGAARRPQYS